ncbi:MAG: hypothetical protein MJE68_12445 [Proteobacteria bacterium]|nr:hypothetical protein [Pseudomonadota bacterium]
MRALRIKAWPNHREHYLPRWKKESWMSDSESLDHGEANRPGKRSSVV